VKDRRFSYARTVHRAFAVAGSMVLALTFGAACSRKSGAPVRASATPPAPMTVRFVNATQGDIFVDAKYGERIVVADGAGRALGSREFCGTDCETCNRPVCGSPESRVRRIPKGGAWETQWLGDFYESGKGGKGDKECTCMHRRFAEDGRYTITFEGRSAAKLGAAVGADPNVLGGALEEAAAHCVASGVVTLGAAPSTAELTWSCAAK
jgi:hypothetical protein